MAKSQKKKLPQLSTQASEAVKQIVEDECGEFGKVQSVVNGAVLVFRDAPPAKKRAAVKEANRLLSEQLAALGQGSSTQPVAEAPGKNRRHSGAP